jgi:hypothetical protein
MKSIRCPGKRVPAELMSCISLGDSTGTPPSSVIISSVSLANVKVIPERELDGSSGIQWKVTSLWLFLSHPVVTTRTLYELPTFKTNGGRAAASPMQSTGRPGEALEQLKRPPPLMSIESGTGFQRSDRGHSYIITMLYVILTSNPIDPHHKYRLATSRAERWYQSPISKTISRSYWYLDISSDASSPRVERPRVTCGEDAGLCTTNPPYRPSARCTPE